MEKKTNGEAETEIDRDREDKKEGHLKIIQPKPNFLQRHWREKKLMEGNKFTVM